MRVPCPAPIPRATLILAVPVRGETWCGQMPVVVVGRTILSVDSQTTDRIVRPTAGGPWPTNDLRIKLYHYRKAGRLAGNAENHYDFGTGGQFF
jgi:hypothetical protein